MRILILILSSCLFMSAKSCSKFPLEGDTVANLYPSAGVARIRTVISSCPLKVSSATIVKIESLPDAGCWVPAEQCGSYTTKYESELCN